MASGTALLAISPLTVSHMRRCSSAIYVGVAIGGTLGGLWQNWFSIILLGVPAGVLALRAEEFDFDGRTSLMQAKCTSGVACEI